MKLKEYFTKHRLSNVEVNGINGRLVGYCDTPVNKFLIIQTTNNNFTYKPDWIFIYCQINEIKLIGKTKKNEVRAEIGCNV